MLLGALQAGGASFQKKELLLLSPAQISSEPKAFQSFFNTQRSKIHLNHLDGTTNGFTSTSPVLAGS